MRLVLSVGALLGIGALFVFLSLRGADEAAAPASSDPPPSTPLAVGTPAATIVIPTASTPVATDDPTESLYQPVAWDHPTHVNRTPPSSLDETIKERAIHSAGWQFEGTPPAVFDPSAADFEVCHAPSEGVSRLQSGDWVLDVSGAAEDGTGLPSGHRRLVLHPIDPALLRELRYIEAPLRIRAVDSEGWEDSHLVEARIPMEDDGAFHLVFESPRAARWMAVVTAGPLWGCFTFDLEADPVRWPSPDALNSRWFPDPPADDDGIDDALWGYVSGSGFNQSASRVCVVATGQQGTRSGEFAIGRLAGFGNHTDEGFSPFRRSSKVIWLPRYQEQLGDFTMRATLVPETVDEPDALSRSYQYLAVGPSAPTELHFTYVTGPVLPQAGTWHLVATAEPYNWGCFTLTVGAAHLARLH